MGKIIAVPIGLVAYVISLVLFLIFFLWFFDKPNEWSIVIPTLTSLFALSIAMAAAETNGGKGTGRTVAFIVAFFWAAFVVIDLLSGASDIIQIITGRGFFDLNDDTSVLMTLIDGAWSSKVCAVVSFIMASGDT